MVEAKNRDMVHVVRCVGFVLDGRHGYSFIELVGQKSMYGAG